MLSVSLRNFEFHPKEICAVEGTVVKWTIGENKHERNSSGVSHSIYSSAGSRVFVLSIVDLEEESPVLREGESFQIKFLRKGKYTLACENYPWLKQKISIEEETDEQENTLLKEVDDWKESNRIKEGSGNENWREQEREKVDIEEDERKEELEEETQRKRDKSGKELDELKGKKRSQLEKKQNETKNEKTKRLQKPKEGKARAKHYLSSIEDHETLKDFVEESDEECEDKGALEMRLSSPVQSGAPLQEPVETNKYNNYFRDLLIEIGRENKKLKANLEDPESIFDWHFDSSASSSINHSFRGASFEEEDIKNEKEESFEFSIETEEEEEKKPRRSFPKIKAGSKEKNAVNRERVKGKKEKDEERRKMVLKGAETERDNEENNRAKRADDSRGKRRDSPHLATSGKQMQQMNAWEEKYLRDLADFGRKYDEQQPRKSEAPFKEREGNETGEVAEESIEGNGNGLKETHSGNEYPNIGSGNAAKCKCAGADDPIGGHPLPLGSGENSRPNEEQGSAVPCSNPENNSQLIGEQLMENNFTRESSSNLVLYPSWSHSNSILSSGNNNSCYFDEPQPPSDPSPHMEQVLKNVSVLLSDNSFNSSFTEYFPLSNKGPSPGAPDHQNPKAKQQRGSSSNDPQPLLISSVSLPPNSTQNTQNESASKSPPFTPISPCPTLSNQHEFLPPINTATLLSQMRNGNGQIQTAQIILSFNELADHFVPKQLPETEREQENSFEISKKQPPIKAIELISQKNFTVSLCEQLNQVQELTTDETNMLKIMEFKFN